MSTLILYDCPKCNKKLSKQFGNGRDILLCLKCKYQKTISIEPEIEIPIAPNNYNTAKISNDLPTTLIGTSEFDDIDFSKYVKQVKDCKLIYEKVLPKIEPTYSTKSINELISSPILRNYLKNINFNLYAYQAEAISKITSGQNIVITAPTSSGKTQAFLLPILDKILENPRKNKISALFVYPNKALTADQVNNIQNTTIPCGLAIKQLDGSKKEPQYKNQILSNPPEILATNFDFISYHLAHSNDSSFSKDFRDTISSLKFIVVDETHQCTGFFGTNIKWILKRLQRINPNLQFIASSATLDNPIDFCNKLFPVKMNHVEGNGKRGNLTLQIVKPKIAERSLLINLTRLFAMNNKQVLTFGKSRNQVELIAIDGSDEKCEIFVHRSGISEQQKIIIESSLRRNKIKAVACTPTLELGINLGSLDAVISSFTPYSRLIQRIGRSGRQGQDSYAIMVLDELNPISNYYINNIEKYFEDSATDSINFENPTVRENQILLMAKETPILESESLDFSETLVALCNSGKLIHNAGKYYCSELGWKSVSFYGIRDMGHQVALYTPLNYSHGLTHIGEIEAPLAYDWLYPGALYFHDKISYRCKSFEKHSRYPKAILIAEKTTKLTLPIKFKDADITNIHNLQRQEHLQTAYCSIHVHQQISKYYEKNRNASIDKAEIYDVNVPLYFDFNTLGVAFGINQSEFSASTHLSDSLTNTDGPLHAVKHLLIHAAKMIIGAESNEIDGMIDPTKNTILIFDNSMNGGNGISKAIFENQELIIRRAHRLISDCKCQEKEGCPKCTQWDRCSHFNINLEKNGARKILESMISIYSMKHK